MKKSIFAALALGLAATLGLSSPASAALPSIDLYILATDGKLYTVDTTSGGASFVGDTNVNNSAGGGLNPLDSTVYVVTYSCEIYSLDVTTLNETLVGDLSTTTAGGQAISGCDASTVDGSGNVWSSVENGTASYYLVKFDLASNTATVLPQTTTTYFDALWFDPTDGSFHGMLDSGNIAAIDTSTGAATDSGTAMVPYAYGTVLDNAGNYYSNDWDTLWIGSTSDYTSAVQSSIDYSPFSMNVMTIFTTTNFWPAQETPAELPNTGVNAIAMSIVALGGFALVGLGFVFVVRISRRAAR